MNAISKPCVAITAAGFMPGVLSRVHAAGFMPAKATNKLTPKWESPYRVVRVTIPGTDRLETGDGIQLQNSWNIEHLRKFYS